MAVSERTFEQVLLEDPDGRWELHHGRLREKPDLGAEHNDLMFFLAHLLQLQLSRAEYRIRVNAGHLRRPGLNYSIPDVMVIPAAIERTMRGRPGNEVYDVALPLVVEVWSPSTGLNDVASKVPEYQARGDEENWRLHPFAWTLTVWRRQADGSYAEASYSGGTVEVASLPGVTVDLDRLFAE